MKFSAFLATSLDGYIADESHGIGWLEKANEVVPNGEDCGYGEFFSTVDSLVMGRRTFEQVALFPEWPYGNTPVFVLSNSLAALPSGVPASVTLMQGSPMEISQRLSVLGFQHVYVDGGSVVQGFIEAGLLEEITITLIPVLLGVGISLFGRSSSVVGFTLQRSHVYPFGFVQNVYRVARNHSLQGRRP